MFYIQRFLIRDQVKPIHFPFLDVFSRSSFSFLSLLTQSSKIDILDVSNRYHLRDRRQRNLLTPTRHDGRHVQLELGALADVELGRRARHTNQLAVGRYDPADRRRQAALSDGGSGVEEEGFRHGAGVDVSELGWGLRALKTAVRGEGEGGGDGDVGREGDEVGGASEAEEGVFLVVGRAGGVSAEFESCRRRRRGRG